MGDHKYTDRLEQQYLYEVQLLHTMNTHLEINNGEVQRSCDLEIGQPNLSPRSQFYGTTVPSSAQCVYQYLNSYLEGLGKVLKRSYKSKHLTRYTEHCPTRKVFYSL